MRFLCVALMLQISIADIHGMDQGEDDSCCGQVIKRFLTSKKIMAMAVLFAVLAVGGFSSTPVQTPQMPACKSVPWSGNYRTCGKETSQFSWAIAKCQKKLARDNFCIPVCIGFLRTLHGPEPATF